MLRKYGNMPMKGIAFEYVPGWGIDLHASWKYDMFFFKVCSVPICKVQQIHSCCGLPSERTSIYKTLTFNPKPGQVEEHTYTHSTHICTKTHTHTEKQIKIQAQSCGLRSSKPERMWSELPEEEEEKNKPVKKYRGNSLEGKCNPHQSTGWGVERMAQRYRWSWGTRDWCPDMCGVVSLCQGFCSLLITAGHLVALQLQPSLLVSPCDQINSTCFSSASVSNAHWGSHCNVLISSGVIFSTRT